MIEYWICIGSTTYWMFETWTFNSYVCLTGCKHMAFYNQASINYLSNDWQKSFISLDNLIGCTYDFECKFEYSFKWCILSHYNAWNHNSCHWRRSAWLLRNSQQLDSVVRTRTACIAITQVVSLDVIPLLSHTLHDLISFYNIYISCYLFISLTLKSGAIMFINCLIIPAPVGVNNAFQCVGVEHTLFFFFFF